MLRLIRIGIIASVIAVVVTIAAAVWVGAGTTGIVSGTVVGDDGKPLSGANVIIAGTKLTTVTDSGGYYVITNVPPGDYEVRAEMVGFAKAGVDRVQVTMDTTARVDFAMKQEAIQEQAAVVTRPRPMIAPDQVNTLNLITAGQETLTRTDPTLVNTVPGVLSALPGTNVEPNGSGLPHVRGSRSDQIGYYIEGIPITDPNLGTFSDNLFTTGVGKFQVYTGGFGAQYGNALGCVLNEVKKTGDTAPGLRVNSFGGNGAYRSAGTEIGGGTPGFNYYASGILQSNDVTGSPWLAAQTYSDNAAKLVWPWKKDTLTVLGLQGVLQGDLAGMFYPVAGDFVRQRYVIAGADWRHSYSSKSFLTVRPYYIHCKLTQTMMNNWGMFMDGWSDQAGLVAGYTSQLTDRLLLSFGGMLLSSDNNNYTFAGIPWSKADVNTFQTALYAEQQLSLGGRWTANAGVRLDTMTYDRTGLAWVPTAGYSGAPIIDVTESTITPRLGVSYAPDSRTAWKASWGKYSKFVPANSVQTVYYTPDDPAAEAASPGIGATDPQESTGSEISFEKQVGDSVAYRITPYYADYRHLGDFVTDGTGVTRYVTIGRGEARGVEFYVRKKLSAGWQGWVSYTYQTVKAGDGPGPMDYTAWDQRNTLTVVADCKKGNWGHTLRADFGSGRQDDSAPAGVSRHANPHTVFTYTLTADLPKSSKLGDSLSVGIYNIFNNRQAAQYTYMFGPRTGYSIIGERCVSVGLNKGF